jgi:hypothetical protein
MSTGTNEPEEAVNDRNRPGTASVPEHAAAQAESNDNGADSDAGNPDLAAESYPAGGSPTIVPGPAEEEDRREHDDRGLITDTGSSD